MYTGLTSIWRWCVMPVLHSTDCYECPFNPSSHLSSPEQHAVGAVTVAVIKYSHCRGDILILKNFNNIKALIRTF